MAEITYIEGNEELSTVKRTQVYQVTHDGAGNRLPLMRRSFMSFTYGGKPIEDFNLIVTMGERLNKNIYSDFEDLTSDYTTQDGSHFWGTRIKENTLVFDLATDYMTQQTLEEFKMWFSPGVERDLVLTEHPNRYIRARVAVAPSINMLPFGEKVEMKLKKPGTSIDDENGILTCKTMTTIYKGDITVSFVMSEPYWTGILNYMPYPGFNISSKGDPRIVKLMQNIITTNSLDSEDALKICLEDELPHDVALFGDPMFIGTDESYTEAIISQLSQDAQHLADYPAYTEQSYISYVRTAMADYSHADGEDAIIGYIVATNDSLSLNKDTPRYLFYSGTAPSKPIMKFTIELKLNDQGYITNPVNSLGNPNATEKSYIKVGKNYFYFTTPSICTMYNRVLKLVYEADSAATVFDLKGDIRENIKNKYVRAWALYCLKNYNQAAFVSSIKNSFILSFVKFFTAKSRLLYDYESDPPIRTQENYYEATFQFNSKTGEAKGWFNCLTTKEPVDGEEIIENVGDMVLGKYLIIDERNHLNEYGLVVAGGENNNCTKITTNESLSKFMILYTNMYY